MTRRFFVNVPALLGTLCLLLTTCTQPDPTEQMTTTTTTTSLRFLSLGDSYTIGEGVSEAERWPVQLAAMVGAKGIDLAKPDIIAKTGWTTAELAEAITSSGNTNTYDLVSLLIGVNNQYRGQGLDRYKTEFAQLLQTAIRFANRRPERVLVFSIPDWGTSPFANDRDPATIGKQIDAFNTAARQICEAQNVTFIDITPLTRRATGDATQFAPDGLHYSGKHMRQWAEAALGVVVGKVK